MFSAFGGTPNSGGGGSGGRRSQGGGGNRGNRNRNSGNNRRRKKNGGNNKSNKRGGNSRSGNNRRNNGNNNNNSNNSSQFGQFGQSYNFGNQGNTKQNHGNKRGGARKRQVRPADVTPVCAFDHFQQVTSQNRPQQLNNQQRNQILQGAAVKAVFVDEAQGRIMTTGATKQLHVWDMQGVQKFSVPLSGVGCCIFVMQDWVFCGVEQPTNSHTNGPKSLGIIHCWKGDKSWQLKMDPNNPQLAASHGTRVNALVCHGQYLFSGGGAMPNEQRGQPDPAIRVWTFDGASNSFKRVTDMQGHAQSIKALALTADTKHLVSGAYDGQIGVWSSSDGTKKFMLSNQNHSPITALIPFQQCVVAADYASNVYVYKVDPSTGAIQPAIPKPLKTSGGPSGALCIAHTKNVANEDILVVGGDGGAIKLYQLSANFPRKGLWFPHSFGRKDMSIVMACAAVPNHNLFFTAGTDGLVKAFKFTTPQPGQQQQQQQQFQQSGAFPSGAAYGQPQMQTPQYGQQQQQQQQQQQMMMMQQQQQQQQQQQMMMQQQQQQQQRQLSGGYPQMNAQQPMNFTGMGVGAAGSPASSPPPMSMPGAPAMGAYQVASPPMAIGGLAPAAAAPAFKW